MSYYKYVACPVGSWLLAHYHDGFMAGNIIVRTEKSSGYALDVAIN